MSFSPFRPFTTLAAVALFAALSTAGCGKQGPPLPPLRAVPATTQDLAVVQQGPRLLLSLGYPQVTPAGTALGGITTVEIYQVTRTASSDGKASPLDARAFGSAAKLIQKVEGADLASATEGQRINVLLPLPATEAKPAPEATAPPVAPAPEGQTPPPAATAPAAPAPLAQYFAVRTIGKEGDQSDFSNVAAVVPKTPPTAPERVTVTSRADGVLVEWSPVEGASAGYNVYRRESTERAYSRPVHTAGAQERTWLDDTARFGKSYIYTVTAIAGPDPKVESGIASDHEVIYQDRFPPAAPTELVALAEAGRVRLVWQASEAEDIGGYVVYRRQGEGGSFERITPEPVQSAEHVDTTVRSGQTYTYRVTAVDQTGNESPPGAEVRAAVP